MSMYKDFIIKKIVTESSTIKSFYLEKEANETLEDYKPGQFITVKLSLADGELIRNYTLSDSPGRDYFRLTIKREDHGISSRYFHDELKVGSVIQASAPRGDFHLETEANNPVVLISGGVGITPMLSMQEYIIKNQPTRPVHLLHSSLNKSVRPMASRLREVDKEYRNVSITIFHSSPEGGEQKGVDFDEAGFITKDHLQNAVKANTDCYFCGPVPFMEAMYGHLQSLGISQDYIHYEFFGEGKPFGRAPIFKDSSSISTNNIRVNFIKSKLEVPWDSSHANLLEFAEAKGMKPPSSCRMGTCSTCETRLLKGKINYEPEPFMEPKEGNILICCAFPTGDIEIDL